MRHRSFLPGTGWGAALAALALSACDLTVTNPGPVQAEFLIDKAAITGIVNGAGRSLADALNQTAYTSSAVARELHPAGSTGSFGITVQQQSGKLVDDEINAQWSESQRARWVAEDGIQKLTDALGATDFAKHKSAAQLLLWAGYANRHLGENFCDAVIDGGPKEPYTVYLDRAETNFTQAIAVGTAALDTLVVRAAIAGRASVRLNKGNFAGAAADAATVVSAFVYKMPYYDTDTEQYNRIHWATANLPYRAVTTWNTFYENYFNATLDPRVKSFFNKDVAVGDGAVGSLGQVRFVLQQKYPAKNSAINLSSGWEMRLLEAEVKLIGGDVGGAATLINQHRAALGLAPFPVATAAEAWASLKQERGIELWLESRRLGDLRRWKLASRPGAVDQPAGFDVCYPISRSEKETNPNLE